MSKTVRKRKRTLFNPDEIATAISRKLNRDLTSASQMYGGMNSRRLFFLVAQHSATLKKYAGTASDESALEKEAFRSFLETNSRMREVNNSFRSPRNIGRRHMTPDELLLVRARALVHWVLRDITWGEIVENASHSGGVTRGVGFSDTSMEAKFTWPISTTTDAARMFDKYLLDDVALSRAISYRNRQTPSEMRYDIVRESRATTVPKTSSKRRMIAIEPTLNMFFQQALMRVMYKRLSRVNLDVGSLPDRHKLLAWKGSVTGNLATIDFSSASDCVGLSLVRYLLPGKWMRYVDHFRCPAMNIAGETTELEMVSTMGNAGTFPLETLIFWSIGVCTIMQRTRSNPNSLLSLPEERAMVSVFGDDCILPREDAEAFMANCVKLGFLVNEEKSFSDPGPGFRESCGGDYYRGTNVRPLYITDPTSNRMSALEPWLYIILNGALKKYIEYFGPETYLYDKALLEYIFGLFRKYKLKVKLVPPDFPDDAGLQSEDWRRLHACYSFQLSKVSTSDSGLASFLFCRFRYLETHARDEEIRYADWLKKPRISHPLGFQDQQPSDYFIRRKGSYVVARSLSPSWVV